MQHSLKKLPDTARRHIIGDARPNPTPGLVSVVVVNYNCRKYLDRCLGAMLRQTFADFRLVLVDNASSDSSLADLPIDDRLRVVRLNQNLGFATANNLGAYLEPSQFIATLNPDAFPEPDWLERLVEYAQAHPDYAALGSTQLMDGDPALLDGSGDVLYFFGLPKRSGHRRRRGGLPTSYETFSPCAAAALYRSEHFWRVGGFDDSFFCFCEDVDLGFRLRLLGLRCQQVSEAVVRHVGGGASNHVSGFSIRLGHRNALWMHVKNMPAPLMAITLPCHISAEAGKALLDLLNPAAGPWPKRSQVVRCRLEGMAEALKSLRPVIRKRQVVQRARTASAWKVAGMLRWRLWRDKNPHGA